MRTKIVLVTRFFVKIRCKRLGIIPSHTFTSVEASFEKIVDHLMQPGVAMVVNPWGMYPRPIKLDLHIVTEGGEVMQKATCILNNQQDARHQGETGRAIEDLRMVEGNLEIEGFKRVSAVQIHEKVSLPTRCW